MMRETPAGFLAEFYLTLPLDDGVRATKALADQFGRDERIVGLWFTEAAIVSSASGVIEPVPKECIDRYRWERRVNQVPRFFPI